jgi:hypothetical protein
MKTIKRIAMIILTTMLTTVASVSAYPMDMYINEQYVKRDIVSLGGFDMLPIADIAGELGYYYRSIRFGIFKEFTLYGKNNNYYFKIKDASVYDSYNNWIGLDIVPMEIDGKVRIPSSFITKTLKLSYTWDSVSNAIFINSPVSYKNVKASQLVAHKTSHKFHKSSCTYLPASYNSIYYATREDAIKDCMIPCKVCNP